MDKKNGKYLRYQNLYECTQSEVMESNFEIDLSCLITTRIAI